MVELKVGDVVTVKVAKENREWGYNPCPDRSKGVVKSFGEISYGRVNNYGRKPGIYENRYWCDVQLEDGNVIHIATFHLDGKFSSGDGKFLKYLPETPFWEGDYVFCNYLKKVVQIIKVDYDRINGTRNDGSEYPIYTISDNFNSGWSTSFDTTELKLEKRGDVWKYFHGEKIEFDSLKEEAEFFTRLGKTKEMRNPKNQLYSWNKEEVLQAIKNGIVHGFSMGGFLNPTRINAIRFEDKKLGGRVAAATMKNFDVI